MSNHAIKGIITIDKGVKVFKFLSVERGVQAIIRLDGDNTVISVVNPEQGKPYFIYNDDNFDTTMGSTNKVT